ncbi:allophanate hydrolase subunit 1 [Hansschlegelia quercus]|uniref:Allophanate hydrolase subunit 1 n=1 Tax=Hansschlegelia quercus TaxID=2528245 RepID=A0A4Q9GP26_9HYPH|nr:allophanate hydrolase subunit 1 [Hansschlegelia quercus]TBN55281.1 allophanate hydrolase subunit 1 [Hansschlegelia quercus]
MTAPRFLDAGEAALVVEFGDAVDPAINDRVLALDAALVAQAPEGVLELTPSYRSLLIQYDPLVIDRATLVALAEEATEAGEARAPGASWVVPCCYDPAVAEDLGEFAAARGLSPEKAAALHAAADWRVYCYGFAPGFAYLGGLPKALAAPRRATPRPPFPPGSVMVGGGLGAVATVPMPTGWHVVGRTPERLFALDRDPAFLLSPGDALRFEAIDANAFRSLDTRAAAGEPVARKS